MTAQVFAVDPDPDHRAGLADAFTRAGIPAQVFADGGQLLEAVALSVPLVVLIEVCLPDTTGYQLCRHLRDAFGEGLSILLMSGTKTDSVDRTAGFLLGADDYLVNPIDSSELIARVRRAETRSRALMGSAPGGTASDGPAPPVAAEFGLTAREGEVLRLLAEGQSQRDIATRLVLSEKTVSSHIQHILARLGVHSRAEAVAMAYRLQLIAGRAGPADGQVRRIPRSRSQGSSFVDDGFDAAPRASMRGALPIQ